jgi:hypothetical protein
MSIHYLLRTRRRADARNRLSNLCSTLVAATVLLQGGAANAQPVCPVIPLTSGLQVPLGITQSNLGNLIVGETGTTVPNSGRISVVDLDGNRRTLLDGLPSGINDVGEPSGPAGVFMRGRTLYVAIGVGDVGRAGPLPGTTVPNPNPLSSPIFSSILAIHFSAHVERNTSGFALSLADHQTLAGGEPVRISYGRGETVTIELVADFRDFVANPLPFFANNIQLSNPFDLVAVADRLYVTDGGRNLVWEADIATGEHSVLASFPNIPNPVAPFGPPFIEAVPTGIAYANNRLFVTLLRGFPFPPGTSVVEHIDPLTGDHSPLVAGLKTAIGVLPIHERGTASYLVLQHVSGAPGPPALSGPGILFLFDSAGQAPQTIADCLNRATSMTLDARTDTLYITELAGRIVAIPFRR